MSETNTTLSNERAKDKIVLYDSGVATYCTIQTKSQKIFEKTIGFDAHQRLGLITSYAMESLRDGVKKFNRPDSPTEVLHDKRKAEILGLLIEHYRKRLGLGDEKITRETHQRGDYS